MNMTLWMVMVSPDGQGPRYTDSIWTTTKTAEERIGQVRRYLHAARFPFASVWMVEACLEDGKLIEEAAVNG